MYKIVATFTRPSVDIPFWTPTLAAQEKSQSYGFVRTRDISEDGLVLTVTTLASSEEAFKQSTSDAREGENASHNERNAYNEANGIVREIIFKGTV